ncbi:MAG TPA: Fe-S oxidoreductase [Thermopetrobacter sp.]|nr:Fe-S oxidoreductase [Thermopetrobacter sp.]
MPTPPKEGSLEAPMRHPVNWRDAAFYDEDALMKEMERVFDLCHGCRRCVNLCQAFPTLFDLVDESPTMEMDGVKREDYWKVVDHCYLCDLCFMTKCPYTPPHEWNIDFPHLMLQAKAVRYKKGDVKRRDKLLTNTDLNGKLLARPLIAPAVNAVNRLGVARKLLEGAGGVHHEAWIPPYDSRPLSKRARDRLDRDGVAEAVGRTRGKVALFATCFANFNEPQTAEDIIAVFEHNGIPVRLARYKSCCGMPKLELGDLQAVDRMKETNIPLLAELVDQGFDLVAPVPSCALMFRQELPLMYPDDPQVKKVQEAFFDPFEYLALRHREGKLNTEFRNPLGSVVYHAACHQRVQNFGRKTKEVLSLIPDTQVTAVERCSGHDGTYAVKAECHEHAVKIGRPVARQVEAKKADHYGSDCPMAGRHIEHIVHAHDNKGGGRAEHPITLLRKAYGI